MCHQVKYLEANQTKEAPFVSKMMWMNVPMRGGGTRPARDPAWPFLQRTDSKSERWVDKILQNIFWRVAWIDEHVKIFILSFFRKSFNHFNQTYIHNIRPKMFLLGFHICFKKCQRLGLLTSAIENEINPEISKTVARINHSEIFSSIQKWISVKMLRWFNE